MNVVLIFMSPAGIEPATTPEEGVVISIELRGLEKNSAK